MVSLLLQWRPTLAGEVDGDGSTPLHFASSDGDLSVVRAILRSSPPSVVPMQDSEGLSALHAAALMGHAGVVKKLLKACPDAVELRDGHGGTFLHAAAKEGHGSVVLHALQKQHTMGSVLNAHDRHGNTPLHIAVLAGNAGIVHLMASSGTVRVNVMNKDGLTPFDLAEKSTGFITMLNLVGALSGAGAQFRPQRQDHVKRWSGGGTLWSETTPDSLMVVAVLIATVAFSAAFNVPGSYGDDGKAHLAGQPMYRAFLILDTVAMLSSVVAVMLLVAVKVSRPPSTRNALVFSLHCIWVSLVSMVLAFYAAVRATDATDKEAGYKDERSRIHRHLLDGRHVDFFAYHATAVEVAELYRFIRWKQLCLWRPNYFWERRRHQATRRRIGRQYPLVGYYNRSMAIFLSAFALVAVVLLLALR